MNVRAQRAAAAAAHPDAIPSGAGRAQAFRATELRAERAERNGTEFVLLEGYASVVETAYRMWDFWGEYSEIVSAGAFDDTLSRSPDVSFLVNHRGISMARTTNGSLELSADSTGLLSRAWLNPRRGDVNDLVHAIRDGDITEMSFAFTIERGQWSPDYTEYRIDAVNLDRGDVSAVTYGASPHTSIAARSAEIIAALDQLPEGARRAALESLRSSVVDSPSESVAETRTETGRSVALLEALASL